MFQGSLKAMFESNKLRATPTWARNVVDVVEHPVLVDTDLWKQIIFELYMATGEDPSTCRW